MCLAAEKRASENSRTIYKELNIVALMGNVCVGKCKLKSVFIQSTSDTTGFCFQSQNLPVSSNTNRKHVKETSVPILNKPPKQMVMQADNVLQKKSEDDFMEVFTLGRKLGEGRFGTVFVSIEKATGKEYACKVIEKRKLITCEDVEGLRREIQIMHHLIANPNVAFIQDAYEDSEAVYIVMEFCRGGVLFDTIKERGHYTEKEAAKLLRTIVTMVQSFHSLGVMHRDLKPENFLFLNQQEDSPLKIIDFGLSTFFKPGETFRDVVGTPYYVAPEVLKKHYGPEADIWSAGVILYVLLSGVPPFWAKTEKKIFEEVLHGDLDLLSEPWPVISESAKDLARRMLDRNPATRIATGEILCHPWVKANGIAPDKVLSS